MSSVPGASQLGDPGGSDRTDAPTKRVAGLSLAPFRGLRPAVAQDRVGSLLCPPYDVIDTAAKQSLLATDPDNAVAVILPEPTEAGYTGAARKLADLVARGTYAVEDEPTLYVYEMRDVDGSATRGLLGAVELRDPADGVILPHENTMAGPVADRLEVMTATGTDLEPIYLVYDGGGAASDAVRGADGGTPLADTITPDGVRHRLWALRDPSVLQAVSSDIADRRALIADGHHRYATYRERQRILAAGHGAGAWDRGMALLVDSTDYGPRVHAIHRVVPGLPLEAATAALTGLAAVADGTLATAEQIQGFAVVLTDGARSVVVTDPAGTLAAAARRPDDVDALADLDVTLVHRGLVERAWSLPDDVEHVGYAHSEQDAVTAAAGSEGIAVLLRPTPVAAVAAVAAAGARMPRKSTLFTPKPASGLVMRRLADQDG